MIVAGNLPPPTFPPQKQGLIKVLLTIGWLAIRWVGFQIYFWAPPKVGFRWKKRGRFFRAKPAPRVSRFLFWGIEIGALWHVLLGFWQILRCFLKSKQKVRVTTNNGVCFLFSVQSALFAYWSTKVHLHPLSGKPGEMIQPIIPTIYLDVPGSWKMVSKRVIIPIYPISK